MGVRELARALKVKTADRTISIKNIPTGLIVAAILLALRFLALPALFHIRRPGLLEIVIWAVLVALLLGFTANVHGTLSRCDDVDQN